MNDKTEFADYDDLDPCPFCGGTNFEANTWNLNGEEIFAVECVDCLCSAPLDAWQQRAKQVTHCPKCENEFSVN